MRTYIENYLHIMKNCIRPPCEKLKSLKAGFIENSNFENNRDPCPKDPRILGFCKIPDPSGACQWAALVALDESYLYLLARISRGFLGQNLSLWAQKKRSLLYSNHVWPRPSKVVQIKKHRFP